MTTKNYIRINLLVLLISFISPLAGNLYVPSLPGLEQFYHATNESLEFTITSFLFGFGISQLIYGPLSDRFGRRHIIFIGMCIALIGSIGCAMTNSVMQLIVYRFILGCGVGAGAALTRSILRDAFTGKELTRAIAVNGMIFTIAPVLTPLLGSYIDQWLGWEANFITVAIYICLAWFFSWLFLSETNLHLNPTATQPSVIFQRYYKLLSDRTFTGYLICSGCAMSGISTFTMISPFLFQQHLGVSIVMYGWIIALITSGMLIGRALNMILIRYFPTPTIMNFGNIMMIIAGLFALLVGHFDNTNIVAIIMSIMLFMMATGIIMPNAFSGALSPFASMAGAAAALYGSGILLISSVTSAIVATFRNENPTLLASIFLILGCCSWLADRYLLRKPANDHLELSESLGDK